VRKETANARSVLIENLQITGTHTPIEISQSNRLQKFDMNYLAWNMEKCLCECGNEPSSPLKDEGFLDYISNCKLTRKYSVTSI
jgi:hypothetical protein